MFTKVFCLPALLAVALAALPSTASARFLIDDFAVAGSVASTTEVSPAPTRTFVGQFGTGTTVSSGTLQFSPVGSIGSTQVISGTFGYNFGSGFDFSTESGVTLIGATSGAQTVDITFQANGSPTGSAVTLAANSTQDLFFDFGALRPARASISTLSFIVSSGGASTSFSVDAVQAVPEPTSIALALIGGAGCFVGVVRRRRKAKLATR